ncbi:MAG: ABC transporter ATP-binding protein [Gammaproteobacteria bacterium]|nr:ABC transporter ATP-binding protein [Gammaproteobacteria bacterium]
MNAIELKAVSKTYDRVPAVDSVSTSIQRGERVVILGPSGCGKTTLLRLVAGLEVPDSGTLSIDGQPVAAGGHNLVEPEQRHIGMVFQDLALWPHMTVSQHLEFALRYDLRTKSADRPARIREVLEMVRMGNRALARPGELSGGQQQRVALARALVANPAILLMDEPLSSLDSDLNLHLRQELLTLYAALGFTLVYVTHNREEAEAIGTRVIAMRDGRTGDSAMTRAKPGNRQS